MAFCLPFPFPFGIGPFRFELTLVSFVEFDIAACTLVTILVL